MDNQQRQNRLDRAYRIILALVFIVISIAVVGTFIQIYAINLKIHDEVAQIQEAQSKNRATTQDENNVVLGYLECIATIAPSARTPAIINACVTKAEKSNQPYIK